MLMETAQKTIAHCSIVQAIPHATLITILQPVSVLAQLLVLSSQALLPQLSLLPQFVTSRKEKIFRLNKEWKLCKIRERMINHISPYNKIQHMDNNNPMDSLAMANNLFMVNLIRHSKDPSSYIHDLSTNIPIY